MSAILPLPRPPRIRGGLETVSVPLVGLDGEPLTEAEWNKGVIHTNAAQGETFVSGYGGGSYGTDPDSVKPTIDNPDAELFMPVTLGAIFECQMNAPGGTLGDVSQQRAVSLLERRTYSDLAEILLTGENYRCDSGDQNPGFIANGELAINGDVGGSPRGVLQGLLDGVCGGWESDPVFHIPRAWMSQFIGELVHWDEANEVFRFGPHRVSFDCYPNEGPTGSTPANPNGSEVWVWASLPPKLAVSEEISTTLVRTELQNRYQARAEREAIIAFDTGLVLAAKAIVS